MPNLVEYHESGYLFVSYADGFSLDVFRQMVACVKERNCFLVIEDVRSAVAKFSTTAIYEFPEQLAEVTMQMGVSITQLKRAVIAPVHLLDDFRFFETVSLNRSQSVHVFCDVDEARAWLMSDHA